MEQTLELHRDKLTRSVATDLKTVIKHRAVARSGIDAFKAVLKENPKFGQINKKEEAREQIQEKATSLSRKSGLGGMLGKGILASMTGSAMTDHLPAASDEAPAAAVDGVGTSNDTSDVAAKELAKDVTGDATGDATGDEVEMTPIATPMPAVRVQALPVSDDAAADDDDGVTVEASAVVDGVAQPQAEA